MRPLEMLVILLAAPVPSPLETMLFEQSHWQGIGGQRPGNSTVIDRPRRLDDFPPDVRVLDRVKIYGQAVGVPGKLRCAVLVAIVETARVVGRHRLGIIPREPWVGDGDDALDGKLSPEQAFEDPLDGGGHGAMHDETPFMDTPVERHVPD